MPPEAGDVEEVSPRDALLLDVRLPVVEPAPGRQNERPGRARVQQLHEVRDAHVDVVAQVEALARVHREQQVAHPAAAKNRRTNKNCERERRSHIARSVFVIFLGREQ